MAGQKIRQYLDAGGAWSAGWGYEVHRALGLVPAFQDDLDLTGSNGVANDEVWQISDP